jgi:CubicO group peptidase (beta-lactamase class C family)
VAPALAWAQTPAPAPAWDITLAQGIDAFVEDQRRASGIPGIALAIANAKGVTHLRGFGHDGRGAAITGNTPFPIGSLTKSFTALLVRQAIDAGQLDAVLQAVTGQSWQALVQTQVLQPLAMQHSHTDHDAAWQAGMTALHRMWFAVPVAQHVTLLPGFAPTGSLVASASDMAAYVQMLLAGGVGPSGRVVSSEGVAQLLAPASVPARSTLLSADFQFRYGEGWFVGPFGAATDARWHLGNLASFAAWVVLLPDTRQAVVLLINANTELPFNQVNATISRLPMGVVNLLRGHPAPPGPSLRRAYLPLNVAAVLCVISIGAAAWWAARTRRAAWSVGMVLVALALGMGLRVMGLGATILAAFAPDFALLLAVMGAMLGLPAAWRALAWARRRAGTHKPGTAPS